MKESKKVTVKQLQCITEFLNFLGRCIIPGCTFTRRMYAYTAGTLMPHHHIRITKELRLDLEMWHLFLQHPSAFCRPFMDYNAVLTAEDVNMYSDAAGNKFLGFAATCQKSWLFNAWDPHFIERCKPSIEYLELYAVATGIVTWIHRFKNKRIYLFCDNMSVVAMINSTTSSCKQCMVLIRIIVLYSLMEEVRVYAKHVRGSSNIFSDLLSRQR